MAVAHVDPWYSRPQGWAVTNAGHSVVVAIANEMPEASWALHHVDPIKYTGRGSAHKI